MSNRTNIETFANELKVPEVVSGTSCMRHQARVGQPCFRIYKLESDGHLPGICNQRALKFGFVGEIDPRSLERAPRTGFRGLQRF